MNMYELAYEKCKAKKTHKKEILSSNHVRVWFGLNMRKLARSNSYDKYDAMIYGIYSRLIQMPMTKFESILSW